MTKLVWKIRWFWDDADHEMERWFEQMAREGLHLKRVSALRLLFIFERGEPADVSYRIDFRTRRTDPHYLQLFQDAGWERVDELLGWQFWRAPADTVRVAEIFTDAASLGRKYKQLLWLFIVPFVLQLPFAAQQLKRGWSGATAYVIFTHILLIYCIARLIRRLRSLQRPS